MGASCSACDIAECEIDLGTRHPGRDADGSAAVDKLEQAISRPMKETKSSKEKKKQTKAVAKVLAGAAEEAAASPGQAPTSAEAAVTPVSAGMRPEVPLSEEEEEALVPDEESPAADESFVAAAAPPTPAAPLLMWDQEVADPGPFPRVALPPLEPDAGLPFQLEADAVAQAPPRHWAKLPSVGTWLLPVHRSRAPAAAERACLPAPERAAAEAPVDWLAVFEEPTLKQTVQEAPVDWQAVFDEPILEQTVQEAKEPPLQKPFHLLPSVGTWYRPLRSGGSLAAPEAEEEVEQEAELVEGAPASKDVELISLFDDFAAAPVSTTGASLLDAPLAFDPFAKVSYGSPTQTEWKEDLRAPVAVAAWTADQLTPASTTLRQLQADSAIVAGDSDGI